MDINDTHDVKRPKVEEPAHEVLSDTTGFATNFTAGSLDTKHEELWFEDGNVFVIADGAAFKLHAGVLKRHSAVFRDLLDDTGRGGGHSEVFEGCQVLRVTDKVADLIELFLILYDGGSR